MNKIKSRVSFASNGLSIEGVLHSLDTTNPTPGIVVCHPHPLYGGSMTNNVVVSLCEQLNDKGMIALRFNFRGVGASQGAYGGGVEEVRDALGALSFLSALPNVDSSRTGLAGYSFGAYVALRAANADERVAAVAAISPPVGLSDMEFFYPFNRPKMLISGARDDLVDSRDFAAFAEKVSEPKVWDIAPQADHFWIGLDRWLGVMVANFFARTFGEAV